MNKYQDALDKLMSLPIEDINKAPTFCRIELGDYSEIGGVDIDECRTILEELIDVYVEQEKEHKISLREMAKCIERYENALDKACDRLESMQRQLYEPSPDVCSTKEQWKEWLLKNE